jgi:hypothetical protein
MLPNLLKMRLRGDIPEDLVSALNRDSAAAKDLLRIDRSRLIKCLSETRPRLPVTMENVVYFWNAIGPQHQSLTSLTPELILEAAQAKGVNSKSRSKA